MLAVCDRFADDLAFVLVNDDNAHSDGKRDQVLPILCNIGFDIVHPIEPESNDIFDIKRQWGDKLALASWKASRRKTGQ
jgi:hypothetical protein